MFSHDARAASDVFWGEIAPCEHLIQLYDDDDALLDALEGFASGGLRAGEGVIIVATPNHLQGLNDRLRAHEEMGGFNLDAARDRDQYIAVEAEKALSRFMVDGWPDDELFEKSMGALLRRARGAGRFGGAGRRVRAFGEMVALLWSQGHSGATVRLEHLWNVLCHSEGFSLFCAYPRVGFTQCAADSVREICAAHSRVLPSAGF